MDQDETRSPVPEPALPPWSRSALLPCLQRPQTEAIDLVQFYGRGCPRERVGPIWTVVTGQAPATHRRGRALPRLHAEGSSADKPVLAATSACDSIEVRHNLMYQHPSDWHNNTRVVHQADALYQG